MSLHKFVTATCPKKRKLSDGVDCNGNVVKPDNNCIKIKCMLHKIFSINFKQNSFMNFRGLNIAILNKMSCSVKYASM